MTKSIPESFEKAAASLFGYNGGNAESPVWLCGLEWGGGWDPANPHEPDFVKDDYDPDSWSCSPATVSDWTRGKFGGAEKGRPGGSAFFRTQISLLRAIVTDKEDEKARTERDPYGWVKKFKFFSKGHYGLSLNAFHVSMKGRQGADKRWKEDKSLLVSRKTGKTASFAEWTGLASFEGYKDWCVGVRREVFSAFRREYHPAIIYCGGVTESRRFLDIWTDETESTAERKPIGSTSGQYCWLDNGAGKNPTLLAVGSFFGAPNGLNSYAKCWALGRELRRLADEKFNDGGAWLQKEKFMPQ